MSIHRFVMQGNSPSPDAQAEAERWYARLMSADCSELERVQFQRWYAVSQHAAAYAASERLWQSIGELAGHPHLEQLSRQVLADTAKPWGLWRAAAAAVLLSLIAGAVFVTLKPSPTSTFVYVAKPGERDMISLVDSSQLVLNSATELEVRFDRDARRVTLRKGEALFTVAQDAKRPFKVVTGDSEVTALGTSFQVRREGEQITVTLLEGRIAIDRAQEGEHIQLSPGDQVRFRIADPQMARRTVDPQTVASWTTGRLRFHSTPLSEVLDEVNRYSDTQLRVTDPALASTPISGTFDVGDSDSVVSALEALLPVRAEQGADKGVPPDVTLIVPR